MREEKGEEERGDKRANNNKKEALLNRCVYLEGGRGGGRERGWTVVNKRNNWHTETNTRTHTQRDEKIQRDRGRIKKGIENYQKRSCMQTDRDTTEEGKKREGEKRKHTTR